MRKDDDGASAATLPAREPPPSSSSFGLKLPSRYHARAVLGRGGMGEILLAQDESIGRDVALKTGFVDGPEDLGRFEREVRLQGQLEHPNIVPVYDLGTMPDGSPFFTMKRVHGETLDSALDRLRAQDPAAVVRFTRGRLLAIFVTVAQSVHYANTRGVIHRDLKPANVMVGDFGEVYVLDWGIAKAASAQEEEPRPVRAGTPLDRLIVDEATATRHGELLGTIGYMSPEQIEDSSRVDARADVYALGAILFELLTREKLHHQARAVDMVEATLRSVEPRIRERAAACGVPPELAEICVRATLQADVRSPSVEHLVTAVQGFLDGDRDLELRQKMANDAAMLATEALLRSEDDPEGAVELRSEALTHAGRALALDPTHAGAQKIIVQLMVDAPEDEPTPEEVEQNVERSVTRLYRRGAFAGACLFGSWVPFTVVFALARPQRPGIVVAWTVSIFASIAMLALTARGSSRDAVRYFGALVSCVGSIAISTRIVGLFVMVPGIMTLTTMIFILLGKRSWHPPAIAIGGLGLCGPMVLERLGVIYETTKVEDGVMHVRSDTVQLDSIASLVALLVSSIGVYVVICLAASYFQLILETNARRVALQSWKLASLAPADKKMLSVPPPSSTWMRRSKRPK